MVEKWWRGERKTKEIERAKDEENQCLFVDDWSCPIKGRDFPLEVCNTCINAREVRKTIEIWERNE